MNGDTWAPGRGTPVRYAPRVGQGQDDTDIPAALEPPPPERYWFVPAERTGVYAVWWTVYGPGQHVGTVKLAGGAVEWITMKEFCGIFERPARRAAEEAAAAGEIASA